MDIGITDLKSRPIEEILQRKATYKLPVFQREYSWTKSEWNEFIEDGLALINSKEGHFFGFMTFRIEVNGDVIIIEGQQRLSTLTILICLVRDILYQDHQALWEKFDQEFIKSTDTYKVGETRHLRLQLSDLNHNFFRKYIQEVNNPNNKIEQYKDEKKVNKSNQLIWSCYKYFLDEINKQTKKKNNQQKYEFLRDLIQSINQKFIVVSTEVRNEIIAYNIFQTLNNRGLDLSLTDLMKVYLFGIAGSKIEDAKIIWDEIRENLGQVNTNTFFRHYWLSTEGIVKESDLLKEMKKRIKGKSEVINFLENLKSESEMYEALISPSKDYWGDKEIVELLEDLQILSKQLPLPILLAVSKCLNTKKELKQIIDLLTKYTFRYQTIAEKENKNYERLLSDTSIQIRKREITKCEEIAKILRKEDVDDETFQYIFVDKEIKRANVAKYIFRLIEKHLDPLQEKFSSTLTLEHILPRKPDEEWKKYLIKNKMVVEDFVHRIGNMTILLGKINSKLKNKFITKKSKHYEKDTVLKINQGLIDKKTWNTKDIEDRSWWLAELANDATKI